MSVRLGLILSEDCRNIDFINIKEEYRLGLHEIKNRYVKKQLLEDELFFQATQSGDDSLTGIGSYDIYIKDESIINQTIGNRKVAEIIINEFRAQKKQYEKDVLFWIEFIRTLKYKYKINKVGLFWHLCSTSFDKEKIIFTERVICRLSEVDMEYMMKIKKDVIVFFE